LASAKVEGELLLHPAFYAARGLAELGGNERYHCRSSRPGSVTAAAGTDREGRRVVFLANVTGQRQKAVVEWSGQTLSAHLLDEVSLSESGAEPWRAWRSAESIELLPYAVGCLRYLST
jgi:hypothetical protein